MKKTLLVLCAALSTTVVSPVALAEKGDWQKLSRLEKPLRKDVSAEFNYNQKSIQVKDAKMAYYQGGTGDPIVFIHGIPSWSYSWRNTMPYLEKHGRVIAVDLPGYGNSTRGSAKSLAEHTAYFEAFMEKMQLKNVTLVIQDLGGTVGLDYAAKHPDNIKALAFGEIPAGEMYSDKPLPGMIFPQKIDQRTLGFAKAMKNKAIREDLVLDKDVFMTDDNFSAIFMRQLTRQELDQYQKPFKTRDSKRAISDIIEGFVLDGQPNENYQIINNGLRWLTSSQVPKLMFEVNQGKLIPKAMSDQIRDKVDNLTVFSIGEGRHFFQEDHPHKTGRLLSAWYEGVKSKM